MPNVRTLLLGRRLASHEIHETKISNPVGLAVFSSDALSSVAYGTQAIMDAIGQAAPLAGLTGALVLGAMAWSWWAALGIVGLLLILNVSYRQTIHAYPNGGGAYLVAKDNLGELAAQTAGASLLLDYILTVAVSISAGVSALVSVYPVLDPHRVALAVALIAFVATMNLRGVKESGFVFSVPTYGFVVCVLSVLAIAVFRALTGSDAELVAQVHRQVPTLKATGVFAGLWLFMKAYAAGCTALTGVEAISNGVTVFKDPVSKNAATTMTWMVVLLATMFLGITFFAIRFGLTHHSEATETLLSALNRKVLWGAEHGFGRWLYLATQFTTTGILALAANTAYADFPRLAAIQAGDGFLPRQFTSLGDRLVFSNGILILSVVAAVLVVAFHAREEHLLDLYALGVFLGFTISQTGMVLHWRKQGGQGWWLKALVNGTGAVTTFVVMIVVMATKFFHGVWVVVFLVPLLVWIFFKIHRYYIRVHAVLASSRAEEFYARKQRVVVLVAGIHRGVIEALHYAKAIAGPGQVEAWTIDFPDHHRRESRSLDKLRKDWFLYSNGVPLVPIESPYRKVVEPVVEKLEGILLTEPELTITVILPEFVEARWWETMLHNQTALRLKAVLRSMPKVVVISIPYHLEARPG